MEQLIRKLGTYHSIAEFVSEAVRLSLSAVKHMHKTGGGNMARVTVMTPPPKDAYVCSRCGYVLPKKDAVISGWDAEHSSTHVHCPIYGKIKARYVK